MDFYDKTSPLPSNYFSKIYENLRRIKSLFFDRFSLDHNFDLVNDTDLVTADGYHKQLTLPKYNLVNEYQEVLTSPVYVTGSNILFSKSINNISELCVRKSDGIYQITNSSFVQSPYEASGIIPAKCSLFQNLGVITQNTIEIVNNRFFLLGTASFMVSPDGVNWTTYSPSHGYSTRHMAYAGGVYMAACDASGTLSRIYTSTDLVNWTWRHDISFVYTMSTVAKILHDGSKFVVIGDGGRVSYSYNCVSWVDIIVPGISNTSSGQIDDAIYANGLFVACGIGPLMTSPDGINWTLRTPSGGYMSKVIYANNKFYITYSGGISYSTNGVTWTAVPIESESYFGNLMYGDGYFLFNMSSYSLCVSKDPLEDFDYFLPASDVSSWNLLSGVYFNNNFYIIFQFRIGSGSYTTYLYKSNNKIG